MRVKWDDRVSPPFCKRNRDMSMGKGKQTTRHSSIASRDGAKAKEGTKMAEPGEKAQKENVTETHEAGDEEHVEVAGLLE